MKPTILYCVTCAPTGKIYVGITSRSMPLRWKEHVSDSQRGRYKFHAAIRKYGPDSFIVESLAFFTSREEALLAEIAVVRHFDLAQSGYNSSPGGEDPPSSLGKKASTSTRHKMGAWQVGRQLSQATREKIATAARNRSPEHQARIVASNRARSSDIWKKISTSLKGRKLSREHCIKLSAAKKGVKKSPETRERMASAARKAWAERKVSPLIFSE